MALYVKKNGQLVPIGTSGGDVDPQSFLITNDVDTSIDLELLNGYDITYTMPINEISITIPTETKHGYFASLNFRAGDNFRINIVNNSSFNYLIIRFNELQTYFECVENKVYNVSLYCDGLDIRIYYHEL